MFKKKRKNNMFIYVGDEDSRNRLIELGFELIKKHDDCDLWVFSCQSQEAAYSALDEVHGVYSDILTF